MIARNSSFTFKGKAVDIKEVGRRLGVRYVLEGSVCKASGKVRISGQLIDAVSGAHIWADRFERDLIDVFALQDEMTVAVVLAIQPKLLQKEIELATRRRPENLTAYDFYLRAMQQFYQTTREGLAEALKLAHRAFELDPRFGLVAALGAVCHQLNVSLGHASASEASIRTPPRFREFTVVSHQHSPISDVMPRPARRQRVCLRSIPPLQYRRGSLGAGFQT